MKTRLILFAFLLAGIADAEPPERFSYQGRIVDNGALANGSKTIQFKFFDAATGGAQLYAETQTVTAKDGLIRAEIGAQQAGAGALFTLFNTNEDVFLELTVDGNVMLPRERVLSAPFAARSRHADKLGDMFPNEFATSNHTHGGGGPGDADSVDGLDSTQFLRSDANDTFEDGNILTLAGNTTVSGLFNIGPNDGPDSEIEMGNENEFIRWHDGRDRFELTDAVAIANSLQVGSSTTAGQVYSRFGVGLTSQNLLAADDLLVTGKLEINEEVFADDRLIVQETVVIGDTLTVGRDTTDDVIVFNGDEELIWDDSDNRFEFTEKLAIRETIQIGSTFFTSQSYNRLGGETTSHNLGSSDDLLITGHLEINGNTFADGTLSTSGAKNFLIDHPLDPEHKLLRHASIESDEMKNLYDGNVVCDERGGAVVLLPAWFQALNREFRYQLTAIGGPGPNLHVAEKISGNRFKIAGGAPGLEVSWQVTGERQDRWALAHPMAVEEDKAHVAGR